MNGKAEVAAAIATLANARNESVGQALALLLDNYIEEAREANDAEDCTDRFRNRQGEIAAYKRIKFNLTRGLGPTSK